jgi:hypothetical protein
MEEVLSRSLNPRIIDLDVTEEFVRYRYPLDYPLGNPGAATSAEKRLVFQDISHIDVFSNHVVFVRGPAGNVLAQLVFSTGQDARMFADLAYSFRAYRSRR